MKGFTKEIKIALVAILGIVVLFFGMNFLKGVTLFSDDNTYYIKFNNISGLSGSSPIMTNGFKVGTVTDIQFDYQNKEEILAKVGIDKELRIPVGTIAEISSDLLGNVQVDLVMGDEKDGFLEPMSTIDGRLNAGAMGKVKEMVPQIEKMLPKVDSILTSVNGLMADPALPATLHHADQITYDLTKITQQINQLIAGINKQVPGLMGKADGVLDKANTTMGNAATVTENLANLDLEATLNELKSTLENLQAFSASLNEKNGTLGMILHDKTMYEQLNSTLAHADSLLVNFKEHPKRYVHFSVFGKKDK